MLRKVKRKSATSDDPPPSPDTAEADQTQPSLNVPDDTRPDPRPHSGVGDATLPMGQAAFTADDLGTSDEARSTASDAPANRSRRPRVDTPRAGAQMANLSRPSRARPEPPEGITPPEVDEPTYTGPTPGRAPKITPTDHELERFLKPGNYFVRVEDVVYAPVTEKALADIVDAGVILGVDEIATEDGVWSAIDTGDLLGGIKARLSHRAHHILSRVAEKKPASEYGRSPLDDPAPARAPDPADSALTTELPTRQDEADAPNVAVQQAPPADGDVAAEETDTPHEEQKSEQPKRRWWLRIPLALLLLTATGAAGAWFVIPQQVEKIVRDVAKQDRVRAILGDVPTTEPRPKLVAEPDVGRETEEPESVDPTPAYQSAFAAVVSARAVANSIDGLLKGAKEAGDEEAITTLSLAKWQREPTAVDGEDLTGRLMDRGDWKNARHVANWLLATRGESEDLEKIVTETLERQFGDQSPLELTTKRFKRIVHVDPGHRPAVILEDAEGARWTVWPDLGDDHWRGDIAVYRLCQLMVCHFEIPQTRAMTVERKTWRALVKASSDTVAEMIKNLRGDFDWEEKLLHGSIRRVPDAVPWPIEATSIWRPWLTTGSKGPRQLTADATDGHLRVAFVGAEKVLPEVEGFAARQLARQISSLLMIDYLVGNWNRFAPREDQWGSRTVISHGLIYSIDDSAAFLGDDSVRVKGRFSWSQRFSKATVDSLERLEEEEVNEFLFPDADKEEKEKLENLWAQRRRALRRVRKLVKEYGAEDVFALDGPRKDTDGE
jgi:hypothetical protein